MANSIEDEVTSILGDCVSALNRCTKELEDSKESMSAKDFNKATNKVKEVLKGNTEAMGIFNNLKKNGFKL